MMKSAVVCKGRRRSSPATCFLRELERGDGYCRRIRHWTNAFDVSTARPLLPIALV